MAIETIADKTHFLRSGVIADFRSPWLGAEALAMAANWTGTAGYHSAGYSEIHTNKSYAGGVVKEHGNLSFSRIFDSGHDDAASQPETTPKIINRTIFNRDVATGSHLISSNYTTSRPDDSVLAQFDAAHSTTSLLHLQHRCLLYRSAG